MSFSGKEVRRAVRDFNNAANDLSNASFQDFQSRINRFVRMINDNSVINQIVKPLLELPLDLSQIEQTYPNGMLKLVLPENMEEQIAYVVQLLHRSYRKEDSLLNYAHSVFQDRRHNDVILKLNAQIIEPFLRELLNRLGDLVEDEVNGKEEIQPMNLQIFSIGNITAKSGSIAIGKDIKQIHREQVIKEDLIRAFLEAGFTLKQIDKVRPAVDELEKEISKSEFDKSRFHNILSRFYRVGENAMVQIVGKFIEKPELLFALKEFIEQNV